MARQRKHIKQEDPNLPVSSRDLPPKKPEQTDVEIVHKPDGTVDILMNGASCIEPVFKVSVDEFNHRLEQLGPCPLYSSFEIEAKLLWNVYDRGVALALVRDIRKKLGEQVSRLKAAERVERIAVRRAAVIRLSSEGKTPSEIAPLLGTVPPVISKVLADLRDEIRGLTVSGHIGKWGRAETRAEHREKQMVESEWALEEVPVSPAKTTLIEELMAPKRENADSNEPDFSLLEEAFGNEPKDY